jgi:hypothetical protein
VNPENCLNFSEWELFLLSFVSGVSNLVEYAENGVFSTFKYKAFSVEMSETSFSEYKKLKG